MPKFKRGQVIEAIENGKGFEEATVLSVFTSQEKKTRGKQMYLLKIINGTATVPVGAEVNYQLIKNKK